MEKRIGSGMSSARRIAIAALACAAAMPGAVAAQKIESVKIVPPRKTKDRIVPTVKAEAVSPGDRMVAGAENALHCPGDGFVQHAGETRRDGTSGQAWLDKIDSETTGFHGEAMFEIRPDLRVHAPGGLRAGGWTRLTPGRGDDATLEATGAGGMHVEWNRFTGDLVIRTATGRFVANCGRPR